MDASEFIAKTEAVAEQKDFNGAVTCAKLYATDEALQKVVTKAQIRELVRRCATTPDLRMILDHVGLMDATITQLVRRLELLLALKPGVFVSSESWGFGTVQKVDYFYAKVIIDFPDKVGHSMGLAVAGQSLTIAKDDHIMTQLLRDRDAVLKMVTETPGVLLRSVIASFGPMPVQRVEEIMVQAGIIQTAGWKKFWEAARRAVKADKAHPMFVPVKRTESLKILDEAETYGDSWLKKLQVCREPKTIYTQVLAFLPTVKDQLTPTYREVVAERLRFALLGAYKTDPALYVQVMLVMDRLALSTPEEIEAQCDYLMDEDERVYLQASQGLSTRDIIGMFNFLQRHRPACKTEILKVLPEMTSMCLGAFLEVNHEDEETGVAVRQLLTSVNPVATLLVWALRNRATAEAWAVSPLFDLVMQAVYVVEQKLSGEELRMRNTLQAFFESVKWLEETMKQLSPLQRQVLFERVQAAIAWETSSQRTVLNRMVKFDAQLQKLRRSVVVTSVKEHMTSWRSLMEYKQAYEQLIHVDMPKNAQDIAVARSYGDLRENFEYQAAKDHQRQLLSKQDEMDRVIKQMKGTDFADARVDVVSPGTQVAIKTGDGEKVYTVLGELDRDEKLNIISSKSRLALSLLDKKVGDVFELPTAVGGSTQAEIIKIMPYDETVRQWLAFRPGTNPVGQ